MDQQIRSGDPVQKDSHYCVENCAMVYSRQRLNKPGSIHTIASQLRRSH